jgi:hypothetical protein
VHDKEIQGSQLDFQIEFYAEEACVKHLRKVIWPEGFEYSRCWHREAWFVSTGSILDCKSWRVKINLTAQGVVSPEEIDIAVKRSYGFR